MQCHTCGTPLSPDVQFCPHCGTAAPDKPSQPAPIDPTMAASPSQSAPIPPTSYGAPPPPFSYVPASNPYAGYTTPSSPYPIPEQQTPYSYQAMPQTSGSSYPPYPPAPNYNPVPPIPLPPTIAPRKRKTGIIIGSIAAALVVIIAMAVILPRVFPPTVHEPAPTATTTPPTPNIDDEHATATAQVAATITAANPDSYPPAGEWALVDPLNQPYAWPNKSDTDFGGQCQFSSNMYQISQSQPHRLYNCDEQNQYTNFAFEVKMTINQGNCGGLMLRNSSDNLQDYVFVVCQDGFYKFDKYTSSSGSSATHLTTGNSSQINQGTNQVNVIAVVANGSNFELYVNHQHIDHTSDSTFSQGTVGLIAFAADSSTQVTYQDAKVWTF